MPGDATRSVHLLFTDIEGSTRLLQRLGEDYREVLETHFALLFAAVRQAGGTIVNTMGDGLFAVFPSAPRAVEAALDGQRRLVAHQWPAGATVRVRMGVHSGAIAAQGEQYVGLDVHRAARICGAAHGGQVLLSGPAAAGCQDQLAADVALHDLGSHLLRDIDAPERLLQATAPGLLSEFPPPRARNVRPHNLPSEVTEFIGRARERDELAGMLRTSRLVTLLGPGGAGKTRLALQVAKDVLPEHDGGVFFVALEAIRDASVVTAAIGRALGISESGGRPILNSLIDRLGTDPVLLVLDNFEQLLDAAPIVAELLAACPRLTVLITSRSVLRIDGERIFELSPLAIPSADEIHDWARLGGIAAVELFLRRAAAVRPGFTLTAANAAAVAQVVRRLEGMPLAIEIAAARLRLFTPEALAHHLEGGFKALGDGMRGAPAHHRTLRDAVAWSYNLLSPRDKAVFRRLGVFVGGFTLEAAEAVTTIGPGAATTAGEVIEAVGSLVDQSLLRSGALHGEARLTMLESIREFALDQLAAAGESDEAAIRHVSYMLRLAEEIEPHLTGRNELLAVDKLTADQGNLRAALRACLDGGRAAEGLRMACAVWRFWHASGQISEGRRWLEQLLALEGVPAAVRAKALGGLAGLVYWQADYASALSCYEEALALHRELGDRFMEADTLFSMSTTLTWSGDATAGSRMADQALAMFEQLGSRRQVGMVLMAQGFARWMSGDLPAARPLWEASLAIARETGDWVEAATKVLALASIKFRQGEEDAALADALGALRELVALKHVSFTIMALDWVAALAARRAPAPSMRLAGAASRLRSLHGGGMRPEASGLESARVTAGRQLDAATAERLWAEGVTLKLEDAVASALELGAAALVAA